MLDSTLTEGEICITHLAMIAAKITQANSDLIFNFVPGKTKRELKVYLDRIDRNGVLHDEEKKIEVRFFLTTQEYELLKRSGEVLSSGGKSMSEGEVVIVALKDLLHKRDPLEKEKRYSARIAKKEEKNLCNTAPKNEPKVTNIIQENIALNDLVQDSSTNNSQKPDGSNNKNHVIVKGKNREYIPAITRHELWQRDGGICTVACPDGSICGKRHHIEIDHIVMVSEGGGNQLSNLRLSCRSCNQLAAMKKLGVDSLKQYYQN